MDDDFVQIAINVLQNSGPDDAQHVIAVAAIAQAKELRRIAAGIT